MDTFLEFIKEGFKGIVRAISAHLFQKAFLNKRKPPVAVGSRVVLKNKLLTTITCTAEAVKRGISTSLFYYLYPFYM